MGSGRVVLLTVLVLFSVLQVGTTLRCYDCGKRDPGCNDPFVNTTAQSYEKLCVGDQNVCLKVVHPDDGDCWFRMCGKEADCALYSDCYFCSGEKCNSSSSILPSFIIIGGFTVLLAKLFL